MPAKSVHQHQFQKNRELLQAIGILRATPALSSVSKQWEVIVTFYMAVHWVDAALADGGAHPASHVVRERLLDATWKHQTGGRNGYSDLYVLSRRARYDGYVPTPQDLKDAASNLDFVVQQLT